MGRCTSSYRYNGPSTSHRPAFSPRSRWAARRVGEAVLIEVSDDGPGVPPGQLPHIFERFYRAGPAGPPRAGTASQAGTLPGAGLGLAIAAEIAFAHAAPRTPWPLARTACGSL